MTASISIFLRMLFIVTVLSGGVHAADYRTPGLSPEQLQQKLGTEQAPLVVDVRKPAEFGVAHIPGAINVPVAEIGDRLDELRHENGVLLYCINGSRTRKAEAILLDAKIADVYHLEGTFTAWIQAKYPVEKGGIEKNGW